MTDEQRNELRTKIQAELETLQGEVEQLEESTKPVSPDNAIGRVSRMDAIGNKAINERALNSALRRQYQLDTVLSKLDDKEFGRCAMCSDVIPIERLLAIPESSLCVGCASR